LLFLPKKKKKIIIIIFVYNEVDNQIYDLKYAMKWQAIKNLHR
jgi:hypothetical protein